MKYKPAFLFFGLVVFCAAQRKDFEQPAMRPARGTKGAVACGSEYAAEAGMRIYFHGGNAVDAGVATMFAASVSEFSHFGMGGEAPILIRRSCERLAVLRTLAQRAISDMARSLSKTDVEAQLAASLALSVWHGT